MRIEQAWQKRGLLAMLLWPVSLLYRHINFLHKSLYRFGFKSSVSCDALPVVVVGNITVGGTGKSPLVAHLVRESEQRGAKPGIVSRGYGGVAHKEPYLVQEHDSAQTVGDEPRMLFEQTGVPVCVCTARAEAVRYLADHTDVTIVFSDDGLQHLAMDRQAEIIVIDAERGFGNGWFLPAGPMREGRSRLKTADLVVEQISADAPNPLDRPAFQLHPSVAEPLHGGAARSLQSFKGAQVHAVAGIGYPERFFKSLESAGISLIKHALADHHEYKQADIQFDDDLPVLITHKDAVKIKQLSPLPSNIFVVNVRLEPNQLLHDGIMKILDDLVPNSHEEVSQ